MRSASCVPRSGWIVPLAFGLWMTGVPVSAADPAGTAPPASELRGAGPPALRGGQRPSARAITRPASRERAAADRPAGSRLRPAGSWLGSLLSLAAVVAMIVLGAKLWKKHGPPARTALPTEALDVLGRRALDPRQSIYLVRLGSRILVLGSTAGGLSTLAEISDPVEVDLVAGLCRPRPEGHTADQARGFGALFDRHLWAGRPSSAHADLAAHGPALADESHPAERQRRGEEAHA
jgi:flagellar biogenesis protein FliO